MIPKFTLLIILMTLLQSCKKLGLCRDAEFTFSRRANQSNMMRLDGYYYGDISGNNPSRPEVYLFYQNGIFFNNHSFDLENAKTGNVELDHSEFRKEYKGDWGIYRIEGGAIEIQRWTSKSSGCVGLLTEKGEILNDTTFRIRSWEGDRDKVVHSVDAVFQFVRFSPKPDSLTTFIP